jgi:hypothetical protein
VNESDLVKGAHVYWVQSEGYNGILAEPVLHHGVVTHRAVLATILWEGVKGPERGAPWRLAEQVSSTPAGAWEAAVERLARRSEHDLWLSLALSRARHMVIRSRLGT